MSVKTRNNNALIIEIDHPAMTTWPPATEIVRLHELAGEPGGVLRALERRLRGRRFHRIYLVSFRRGDIPRRLRLIALAHAAEVWHVNNTTGPSRLTKSSLPWYLPPLTRALARRTARLFCAGLESLTYRETDLPGTGILYLAGSYAPAVGGIETWMRNAAEGLAESGLRVRVLDRYRFGWREFDAASPVPVLRYFAGRRENPRQLRILARRAAESAALLPGSKPAPRVLKTIESFLGSLSIHFLSDFLSLFSTACRAITAANPSTIHVGFGLPTSQVAWLLSAIGGWPYLVYAHGTENLSWGRNKLLAPYFRASLGEATRMVPNAAYAAELCAEYHQTPRERLAVIHPGVDFARFGSPVPEEKLDELRRRYELPAEAPLLYIVGRVVPRKGFDMLALALPRVLAEHPDVHLLIGGSGEYLPTVRRLVEDEGVGERVRFLGRVGDEEMTAHYRLADLFCMPSRDEPPGRAEGFGIVYIEAGAAGTPSLGSTMGGVPDAVRDGETGLLADPRDPADIAAKINRLLGDRGLLARMGAAAREWAAELDWSKVVERTGKLDEELRREPEATGWHPPGD